MHPPFPSCKISFQEMVFSGTEGLDFQAKRWGSQPQDFLSISFLRERQKIDMSEKWLPDDAQTSGDLHGPLFDSADPAAATRGLETDDEGSKIACKLSNFYINSSLYGELSRHTANGYKL